MTDYKITFGLQSSTRTPFQADTIFGHLAWAMRYIYGEERLSAWLSDFDASPTLLSDAFPEGYIPRPLLKPLTIDKSKELLEEMRESTGEDDTKFFDSVKKLKKVRLIPEDIFKKVKDNLSSRALIRSLLLAKADFPEAAVELVAHNTINRMTSSVLHGGFFHHEESFYPKGTRFYCYLRSETLSEKEIRTLLLDIEQSGFGADKSIGKGRVTISEISRTTIEHAGDANAFTTLSSFIPDGNCGTNGYYELYTKYGKLGGSYATAGNPYKKPMLMMRTGSVIRSNPGSKYGLLLKDVHTDPAIRHYAYAFPYGVRLTDEEAT